VSRSLCQKESFDVIILIACLNGHILFPCRHKKKQKKHTNSNKRRNKNKNEWMMKWETE